MGIAAQRRIVEQLGISKIQINKDIGVLTWGDEIDIAPETLYANATNSRLPDWMEAQDANSENMSLRPTS